MSAALEARLLSAHAAGDRAALVGLYTEAAEASAAAASSFFLTQAYVFALEIDHPTSAYLRQRLVELGAEPPL